LAQVTTPALVLRKFDFGETSQVLHLFTRDYGRVHCLAKGAHRPKSSFGGALDLMELGEARYHPRRDGLAILASFDRAHHYPGLRRDLRRLEAGFAVLEVLHHAVREDHADAPLFDLGVAALRELERCEPARLPLLLLRFDMRALALLGIAPVLDVCVSCGAVPEAEERCVLSTAGGGLLCEGCHGEDPLAVPATAAVSRALAALAQPDPAAASGLRLSPPDQRDARRLTATLLRNAFERPLGRGV
jgi:DNA repair protein RecO (recombination protein O)